MTLVKGATRGVGDDAEWEALAADCARRREALARRGAWRPWRPPATFHDGPGNTAYFGADGLKSGFAGPGRKMAALGATERRSTAVGLLSALLPAAWSQEGRKAPDRLAWLREAAQAAWEPRMAEGLRVRRYAGGWVTVEASSPALLFEASQFGAQALAARLREALAQNGRRLAVRGLRFAAAAGP